MKDRIIAVFGATGQQGGGVVRALEAGGQFRVRALTRNPVRHRGLAGQVVEADLNRPETLKAALAGAHGVFLVTNFWEEGTDERQQATAAVRAAKAVGVRHFIWSTLPDVDAIGGGKFDVPHFTGKARVDRMVADAGFANYTFVMAPFYYQALVGVLAAQGQADGSLGWALPLIQLCGASTWGTSTTLAPSWPAPSPIRIEPAMASICLSSVISPASATSSTR